ncbi:MAG TPA: ATP-binding protein [Acidobacteriota bacterium]|nr:ATP-binding protein [Acidobacteriota bacterium]
MDILNILIVDDEFGMRRGAERALRDVTVSLPDINGEVRFDIRTAATGKELEEKMNEGPTDILVLDHKLPDTTGLDILDRLNKSSLDLLVIMITAYASLDTAVTATRRGAYDFLAKPFTPEELRGAVRKAARHLILQRQARRLAEEKRQVRFQFVSVLAHEMKAPIAAVEGYLQMIHERSVGTKLEDYDRMIDRSLIRIEGMRKLISDLLDLTSIESGQRKRTLVGVDLSEVARQAVENVKAEIERRNISIQLDVPAGLSMEADRTEIEMIFNNLISNAVKYNRDQGRVGVTVGMTGDEVRIQVEDTGIGMTPEETQRLFSDFSRIKNEKTRNILGSGLGLSTLKKIVTLYNGDIAVKSKSDVGSTFTVTLHNNFSAA